MVDDTAPALKTGVIRTGEEHSDLLAIFYRAVWDEHATADRVAKARQMQAESNPHGAGVEVPTFLFVEKGNPVGHITTIPTRLWLNGGLLNVYWLKGLMVLPAYRNGPIGFLTLRAALSDLGPCFAAVVARDAKRLFAAAGFTDLGPLPNRVKILKFRSVLGRLIESDLRSGLSPALRLATQIVRLPGVQAATAIGARLLFASVENTAGFTLKRARVLTAFPSDDVLDQLWEQARDGITVGMERSGAYMRQRYRNDNYLWIGGTEQGRLVAFAVVRRPARDPDPRLHGVRIATLSDLVVHPDHHSGLRALIACAEAAARRAGADAVLCTASHPSVLRALRRRGYLQYSGNVHIFYRGLPDTLPRSMQEWWLTRGDSAADEVF